MKLSQKQRDIIETKYNKVVVLASAAAGKAQPNDTIIPTPVGYKTIGELKPGDKVFNRFGQEETVLEIYPQGLKQVYRVTFADGRVTECCGEHLWSYDNGHKGFTTKELNKMYEDGWCKKDNRGHNSYKYRVPVLKHSVNYPERKYDIEPYIIGTFIGDGCCTESSLTLSSSDEWLIEKVAELGEFSYDRRSKNNYSWDFFKNGIKVKTKEYFTNYLKEICCYCQEKRIPKEYLLGSTQQRLELLRGLMDTDGTTGDGKNSPSYSTTSFGLAEDVLELIRSLGFYGKIFINDRRSSGKNIEYSVNIFTGNSNTYKIFSLPRKVEKALTFKDKPQRTNHNFDSIVNIEKTNEYKEMTCILVDHDEHLYLTNNFIVTHNTRTLTERVRYLVHQGVDRNKIVVITFTRAAASEMSERLGEDGEGIFIGTVHSYATYLLFSGGITETAEALENEDFDQLFELISEHRDVIQPVDYLLLDEAQDSDEQQFEFILDYINPKGFMLFGDLKQTIYSFAGSRPDILEEIADDSEVITMPLNENYRNTREVFEFAKWIIKPICYDNSIIMSEDMGKVETLEYSPELITRIGRSIKSTEYGDWFFLGRTNAQVDTMKALLDKAGIPCETFKRADFTSMSELNKRLHANTVKVLTIHTSKGLEAENVVVQGARYFNDEERRIAYVAATRAKKRLYWLNVPKKRITKKPTSWI